MSGSDKKVGVVGLTLFDLRRRGKVGKLSMVGTSGNKFPTIRKRLCRTIIDRTDQLNRRASPQEHIPSLQ
jgi:D-galacturonate reductase